MFVFCSGGETIKSINQQSGAHVELQRNPPPNTDPNVRIFSIRGSPQQMEMARQLIDEKIGVSDQLLIVCKSVQKFVGKESLKKNSSAQQGCIYLIKNTIKL